jgi:hypothetical protein
MWRMGDAADRRVDESDTSGPLAFCWPSCDAVFTQDFLAAHVFLGASLIRC